MNKEELTKMNKEQLNARLKELGVQAKTAAGDILDGLLQEANDIKDILDMAKKREALQKVADGAEDPKVDEGEGEPQAKEEKVKVFDKRGSSLKAGTPVTFNARIAAKKIQNSLSVTTTAPVVHTAPDVNDTFNPVSALVDMVKMIPLMGGETYQRGFVKGYGTGAATAENADYNLAEPTFGYVSIEKQKITAYCEEPEEMQKLPNADYDGIAEGSVSKAVRRYLCRQIMIGDGTTAKLRGIFFNPTEAAEQVIDPSTDISTLIS